MKGNLLTFGSLLAQKEINDGSLNLPGKRTATRSEHGRGGQSHESDGDEVKMTEDFRF